VTHAVAEEALCGASNTMTGKDLVTKERTSMEFQHGLGVVFLESIPRDISLHLIGVCPLKYPQSSLLTVFIATTRTLLVWTLPS